MNIHIWRYLDLAKFIHLISTETLHFTRVDQFKDKFEGSYPLQNLNDWGTWPDKIGNFEHWRKFACLSCWYESTNESAAMWELYGKDGKGIAICSTKGRLQKGLFGGRVQFEKVRYIDFIRRKAPIKSPLETFRYKRIEFRWEKEFRAILFNLPENAGFENGIPIPGSIEKQEGFPEKGVDEAVDLNVLIEKIVLSPYAKTWYKDILRNILKRYNQSNLMVADSELAADPVYPKK